jgi:L-fuculokinase
MFVDGGFSRNSIYMQLLANAFPEMQVYAAVLPEASAIGAALAIHSYWNQRDLPSGLVGLKAYQAFR